MIILRANALGMCFGVRDALEIARRIESPREVTIHGELVHNETVLRELTERGFMMSDESDKADRSERSDGKYGKNGRDGSFESHKSYDSHISHPSHPSNLPPLPPTRCVMITAHGVSDRERARLAAAGREIIDTTCPLVRRVHLAATELARLGYFVVVVGKAGHVEVEGIVGDLEPGRHAVVGRPDEASRYDAARIGIVFQTTTAPADAQRIVEAIHAANPGKEIRPVMTICRPTLDRQAAARSLLTRVEAMVVVGGRDSNNTRQLVALAREHDTPVLHAQSEADLTPEWFEPYETVGLTAGTSTPDDVIEAVFHRLSAIAEAHLPHRWRETA
jgi:4-hydroxy-3-methylbut-2-en-1-yl diphosphate reductase